MPTVLTFLGLRVSIPTNDHGPPHVHVVGDGKEAKFRLNCPYGPVALYENFGFNRGELRKIKSRLNRAVRRSCREWSKIHGNF